jgi:hypothetical protein
LHRIIRYGAVPGDAATRFRTLLAWFGKNRALLRFPLFETFIAKAKTARKIVTMTYEAVIKKAGKGSEIKMKADAGSIIK